MVISVLRFCGGRWTVDGGRWTVDGGRGVTWDDDAYALAIHYVSTSYANKVKFL
ncbi:hypothetical protein SLEP1_g6442 [Rubroshorea leprosula]|uniref:Uncharacterized protein n=1 Tax=Rubroshorea leprosula TaxID=152421 RepID=A0AAV5I649_9ROSI|nr:hypothetical protein SLEP1_g6442 [Rubroshorea leprosula]